MSILKPLCRPSSAPSTFLTSWRQLSRTSYSCSKTVSTPCSSVCAMWASTQSTSIDGWGMWELLHPSDKVTTKILGCSVYSGVVMGTNSDAVFSWMNVHLRMWRMILLYHASCGTWTYDLAWCCLTGAIHPGVLYHYVHVLSVEFEFSSPPGEPQFTADSHTQVVTYLLTRAAAVLTILLVTVCDI